MQSQVIPELLKLAQSSTMTSRHAAAITYGKRILAVDTNYSLPAGELVDAAATLHSAQCKSRKRLSSSRPSYTTGCQYSSTHSSRKQTPFNQMYERYQGFEEGQVRDSRRVWQQSECVQQVRCVNPAIRGTRCEKYPSIAEASKTYWTSVGATC